ncbi:MAG TPA: 2-phospho-L-lactate guanylyltransferase [Pyrinomonadaceae bacterium]|nr:2-phospho-L-lactate guanylyltransferase [Pyrinomonadaceae bacterium]
MRYLLIPVKELTRAKQRLAPLMSQEERTRLAWLMLERALAAGSRVKGVDRAAVVTAYAPAAELARRHGLEVIAEPAQVSESASVDFAERELLKRGAESVLCVPADLPLLTREDLEAVASCAPPGPSVLLAPSREGTGTNAILRTPPALFPSRFGEGSLFKHAAEAQRRGAACRVVSRAGIALDLDRPEDVAAFLGLGPRTEVARFLRRLRVAERLESYFASRVPAARARVPA